MASTFAGKYVGVADAGPGGAATLAPVLVNVHGGGIATLYTDRGKGTVGPNPVLSDLTARYAIFVDPGVYDIVVRGNTSVVTIQPDSAEYGSGMPPGGAVGQSAIKLSAADYDVGWGTGPSAGVIPLTFTALLTADTTLTANTYGLFDCSGGNRTATLPTAPPDGTRQGLKLSKGVAIASTAVNGSLTTVTLSSAPATALTTGMTVPISGVTGAGATAANGTWPITVLTTTTFTIPVATTGAGTGGTATAFTLSAVCGGGDTIDLPGGATSAVVARVLNQAIICQYKASATSWVVVSSDLPLGQLDLRYQQAGTSVQISAPTYTTTASLQAALNAAAATGSTLIVGDSTLDSETTGLTVPDGVTLVCRGVITFPAAFSGVGVLVDSQRARGEHVIRVQRAAHTWDTGVDATSVGVRFRNCFSCRASVQTVLNFWTGLDLQGDGVPPQGCQDNTVVIGDIRNNKLNLTFSAINGGYSNNHAFMGGQLRHDGGFASYVGTREIYAPGSNGNTFTAVDLEANSVERTLDLGAPMNAFYGCRWESSTGAWLAAGATDTQFIGGYTLSALPITDSTGGKYSVMGQGVMFPGISGGNYGFAVGSLTGVPNVQYDLANIRFVFLNAAGGLAGIRASFLTIAGGVSSIAGPVSFGSFVGFNGNTAIGKAAAIASPTSDTVGTKAAIDAIRVALQNIGITA